MKKSVDRKEIFENYPIPKAIATLAIPTIISQLINLIYNVVDTIFIGRIGNPYMVSAVTVCFTLFMLTLPIGNLFGIGGGSLIARLIGRKEDEHAKKVSSYSVLLAAIISIIYSLIVLIFLEPILYGLGASSQTIVYAKQYTTLVVILGNFPLVISMVSSHILRNSGFAKQASFGLSLGGILNIALDPLFMFVILPKGQEVVGAALATLISNIISMIYLMIQLFVVSKSSPIGFSFKDAFKIRKEDKKELYSVGIPSAVLTAMFDVGNMILNKLAAGHGDLELAAIGIVMKSERLPNAINIGLCQGMLPIVAYNYAAKNEKRKNDIIKTVRLYGLIIAGIGVILYCIFAKYICNIFLSTNTGNIEDSLAVIGFATSYLSIRCFASPFQFLNFHSSYSMQAMGDGKDTLIHAIVRIGFLYIPLMFILNGIFGIIGLVSAVVVGEFLSDFVALFLLKRFQNKLAKQP